MWNEQAKERAESHRAIILNKLREAGDRGVTNAELKEITFRFGQAIHTLYMQGYAINVVELSNGICRYTLVREPEEELAISREKAVDILATEIDSKYKDGVNGETLIEVIKSLGFDVKRKKGFYRTAK